MTRARALLACVVCAVLACARGTDARYRGASTRNRRISGRGIRGTTLGSNAGALVGRRLLRQLSDEMVYPENGHCVSAYAQLARRDELSIMSEVVDSLPVIKSKMQDPTLKYTLFVPTNEAIERLESWEGWEESEATLKEVFGSTRLVSAYMVSYHAVPNMTLTLEDLRNLDGDEAFLEDYLNNVMPLYVNVTDDDTLIVGLGSHASVVTPNIWACGAILHTIDDVLLPFDGDDELDPMQVELLYDATDALRRREGLPPLNRSDIDASDDPIEVVGAVNISEVPTEWTQAAYEYDAND